MASEYSELIHPSLTQYSWNITEWPTARYWNEEQETMVKGARKRQEPIALSKILGSYRWIADMSVYDGVWDMEEPAAIPKHGITLETQPDTEATLATVTGNIAYAAASVHFKDLEEVSPNSWRARLLFSGEDGFAKPDKYDKLVFGDPEDPRNDPNEGGLKWITITVLEEQDDLGHSFLGVYWDPFPGVQEGILDGVEIIFDVVGKKEGEKWVDLTESEKARLGIGLTEKDVDRIAEEKKAQKAALAAAADELKKTSGADKKRKAEDVEEGGTRQEEKKQRTEAEAEAETAER